MNTVNVATVRPSLAEMCDVWDLIDNLAGGTPAMRRQGVRYLPKWLLEDAKDHEARLKVATLFPAYTETVKAYVARLFSKPLIVNKDVPEWIVKEVMEDVNMENLNFQVFARTWFSAAIGHGMAGVLVDAPSFEGEISVEDAKSKGIRPYYRLISARQLLGWKSNSRGDLTQLRFWEMEEAEDGPYNVKLIKVIRVYNQLEGSVSVETHVKVENPRSTAEEWALRDSRAIAVKQIPFVNYYTARKGLMECEPPLRELAYLNQKHWSQQSSTDSLLQTAQVPILAIYGGQTDDTILIGSKHAVKLPHDAKMQFVEHTGAAINTGRVSLDSLKEEMRQAGAKLLPVNNMQAKNTLQAGEEANKESSPLAAMIQDFTDAMRQLIYITKLFRKGGNDEGGTVTVQANMDAGVDPVGSMAQLIEMHKNGAITTTTLIKEGQRRGLLSNEIASEDEALAVLKESTAKMELATKFEVEKSKAAAEAKPEPAAPGKPAKRPPSSK